MERFIMGCTFSFYGTKEEARKEFEGKDLIFEVDEFEHTEEEFHSGIFKEEIIVNDNQTLREVVKDYFQVQNRNLIGEYFTVVNLKGIELLTENDLTIQ